MYKTEDYQEINVTYIDPNEGNYQSNDFEENQHLNYRPADSFQNNDDDIHDPVLDDDREIELKTTERNPLLFSDQSIQRNPKDEFSPKAENQTQKQSALNSMVTKVSQNEDD